MARQATPATDAVVVKHGWITTGTVKTRFGEFEFKGGYPTTESADARLEQLKFNRAVEVYVTQMPASIVVRQDLETSGH